MSTSSAAGILQGLKEKDVRIKVGSLNKLHLIINEHWAEIAEALPQIEDLYEDKSFPEKELAALAASKVYYHMEQYDDALRFALESGSKFDIEERSAYVETLISKGIDDYITKRKHNTEAKSEEQKLAINPKLEKIVNEMFQRCLRDGQINQAIGIALESQRIDIIKIAIGTADDFYSHLNFTYELSEKTIASKQFRSVVLKLLVDLMKNKQLKSIDSNIFLCKCYISLCDAESLAQLLGSLQLEGSESSLLSMQLAFDLFDNENQQLSAKVCEALLKLKNTVSDNPEKVLAVQKLINIILGKYTHDIFRNFLSTNKHTDEQIATEIKETIPQTVSALQEACVWANGIMNACTTDDSFLKTNLEWVGKSSNWAKFSCTSTLGMIHKGNKANAMTILEPYLKESHAHSSPYSAGGAFYSLGLINANQYNPEIISYFINNMQALGQNDVICHGICLGYGLVGMATADPGLYEELKNIMFGDTAVKGEAAALSIGLIMLGSGNEEVIKDLLNYAHETQHEKIIRSISMSLAFIMYGKEEAAEPLFEQMVDDKDPILRYGAMYLLGMAYVGTDNKAAIKKLFHYCVSEADISNDVRRAAITNIGFVLAKSPEKLPKMLYHLSDSYNPYLRCGAAAALGIGCAGTGMKEAVNILVPMLSDTSDFVRQSVIIALSLILINSTPGIEPRLPDIKSYLDKCYKDNHEDPLVKFGSIIAKGILEAGGRNCTIKLMSRMRCAKATSAMETPKMASVISLAIFQQFWYWYPYIAFLSVSLTPTAIIGLNANLLMPIEGLNIISNCQPSMFAYPPPIKREEKKSVQQTQNAVLSTTRRMQAKAKQKGGPTKMEIDSAQKKKEDKKDEKKEEKKEPEPLMEEIKNGRRILPQQIKYLTLKTPSRYEPIINNEFYGIILLKDNEFGKPEVFAATAEEPKKTEVKKENKEGGTGTTAEIKPPEEFIYDPNAQGENQQMRETATIRKGKINID